LALAVVAAVGVQRAGACSCAGVDPRERLADGEAALVGRVVAKRPSQDVPFGEGYQYTVRVERQFHVELGSEVLLAAGANEGSCGFEWEVGERVGTFLQRDGGDWTTNLCQLVEPAELERALLPYPQPLGRGHPALLAGGQFGDARVMALDRRGRILGYGFGRGSVRRISVCPGSHRTVELFESGRRTLYAVRSVRSLRVLRTARLPRDTVELACANRRGSWVFAAAVDYPTKRSLGRVRVFRVERRRAFRLAAAAGDTVAFGPGAAYIGSRDRVLSVDLERGRVARVAAARSPSQLAASPDGERLALFDRDGLRVIELGSRRTRSLPLRSAGPLLWLAADRLLARVGGEARIYDAGLRLRRQRSYRAYGQAHVGRRLFGTDRYRLVELDLRSGRRRTVARLPDRDVFDLVGVPGAPMLNVPPRAPRAGSAASKRCADRTGAH
jgi:hypothetical protein